MFLCGQRCLEMAARIICLRVAPTKCNRTVPWFCQLFISLSSTYSFGLKVEKNILRKLTHQWLAISWVCKEKINTPIDGHFKVLTWCGAAEAGAVPGWGRIQGDCAVKGLGEIDMSACNKTEEKCVTSYICISFSALSLSQLLLQSSF